MNIVIFEIFYIWQTGFIIKLFWWGNKCDICRELELNIIVNSDSSFAFSLVFPRKNPKNCQLTRWIVRLYITYSCKDGVRYLYCMLVVVVLDVVGPAAQDHFSWILWEPSMFNPPSYMLGSVSPYSQVCPAWESLMGEGGEGRTCKSFYRGVANQTVQFAGVVA